MLLHKLQNSGRLRLISFLQKPSFKNPLISYKYHSERAEKKYKMSQENNYSGCSLQEVIKKLNNFAPLSLAESWDNVGLLIEPFTEKTIRNVMLTNDLTENVMQEAINLSIDLIISYHPPIFSPLKKITNASWKERIVAACLENKIAVYSPHTSWDAIYGGVNDWLADAFNDYALPESRVPLVPNPSVNVYEVLVNGSSKIFDDFKDNGNLHIHARHKSNGAEVCQIVCTDSVIEELKGTKSVTLTGEFKERKPLIGMGRIFQISPLKINQCVDLLKKHTGLKFLRLALGSNKTEDSVISSVGLVAGSGGSLLKSARADLFITGEMLHHDVLEANHKDISVILTNHSDSERGFLKHFRKILQQACDDKICIFISSLDCDPIQTV